MIKFGLFLVIAHACITSALPPCVCTRNLKPVCGSDGQTYSNQCLLDCAKTKNSDLTFVREGRCDAQPFDCGPCTLEYRPVCGSDGKSYPNGCAFDCAKSKDASLELRSRGQCETVKVANPLPHSCICTLDYKPVCGSDSKSYPNRCALECERDTKTAHLELRHQGECEKEKVKVAEFSDVDACTCTRNLKPVCGSDGVTYNNVCLLQCVAAKDNKAISVDHVGPCGVINPDCTCTRNLKPVCGSDGTTYNNECLMQCAGAEQAKEGPC